MNKIKSIIIAFLLNYSTIFSQVPIDFGTLSNYIFFTSTGAVSNEGTSAITGDVGTDVGAITLPGATLNGTTQSANAATMQANIDLCSLYKQLIAIPTTDSLHLPTFGLFETLLPGVYAINGAGSLVDELTLDALGDTNAVFLMKFNGAFSTFAFSTVILINGARACNVFWIAENAASTGASTTMVGTVISRNGSISLAASSTLTGRLFALQGAISFGPLVGQKPNRNSTAIIPYLIGCVHAPYVHTCYNINSRSAASFNIFTSIGAVENTGYSNMTGNIGSNYGGVTGFASSTVNGIIHNADLITAQARIDLDTLYKQLLALPTTNSAHLPAFGGSETLKPGIYEVSGAGSIAGNLILDGMGDINAIFVFRIGAALTVGTLASISLINNIRSCNVFFLAKGAITVGALSSLKGTFISNTGALVVAAGTAVDGRLFSITDEISTGAIVSSTFADCACLPPQYLPIDLVNFTGECFPNQIRLNWETASESNNDYFSIERSKDGINWNEIGIINAAGNSSSSRKYFLDDENRYNEISYYRLKQHDFSGVSRTFSPISMQNCFAKNEALSIYPNPAKKTININFNGNIDQVLNIRIVDLFGRNIYQSSIFQSTIHIESFEEGIYFLQLTLKSGNVTKKFLIAK